MDGGLRIQVSEDGADAVRIDALTRLLRQELLHLDVENVTAIPAGAPPPGTRTLDAATVEGLLVALGAAAQGLAAVITLTREWRKRGGKRARKVHYEIDGDVLELSGASETDEDRVVTLFIDRHSRRRRLR